MQRLVFHPLAPLLCFTVVLAALLTTYMMVGITPSPAFEIVAASSWAILLAFWVVTDARRGRRVPCFDFGFYCLYFLPVAVPWYCFWSRGWRGGLMLVALVGLWIMPYVIATMIWIALYG